MRRLRLGPRGHEYDNPFDGSQRQGSQQSGSASRSCISQASTSQGHESPDNVVESKVLKAQEEVNVYAPFESYLRCPLDTSLLHLYVDHVARHV